MDRRALAASKYDGSILLIHRKGEPLCTARPTSFQSLPSSWETHTLPSSEPAQRTPARTGDSATVLSVWPKFVIGPLAPRVRSGLILVQPSPRFVDLKSW